MLIKYNKKKEHNKIYIIKKEYMSYYYSTNTTLSCLMDEVNKILDGTDINIYEYEAGQTKLLFTIKLIDNDYHLIFKGGM